MTTSENKTYRDTVQDVKQRVLHSHDRFWRRSNFSGVSATVTSTLAALAKTNELKRVRSGLYWRGHKTRFGISLPSSRQILEEVIGKDKILAYTSLSAANTLGFSTQVPATELIVLPCRPPQGFPMMHFQDRSRRSARYTQKLSSLEITILEALECWESCCIEYDERFETIEDAKQNTLNRFIAFITNKSPRIQRENVRLSKLVAATTTEPAVIRERLRQILLQLGLKKKAAKIRPVQSPTARENALRVFP